MAPGDRDPSRVRSFVAVLIDDATRAALATQVEILRRAAPRVVWVAPENLHLTLKFLGAVDQVLLEPIAHGLREALSGASAFDIQVVGLGVFPAATRPRVVWAGVTAGRPHLTELAARVQTAVAPFGFAPENRPFSGHLTLGRVREPRRDDRLSSLIDDSAGRVFGTVRVVAVSLMKSVLAPSGARYSEMTRISLGGPKSS